jgi:hypothetical protein
MKKICLTIALSFCFIIITKAQFTPGQITIGFNSGFSYTGEKNDSILNTANSSETYLSPGLSFGKFISANHEISLLLSYGLNSQSLKTLDNRSLTIKVNTFGAGFLSKYYFQVGKKFFLSLNWLSNVGYYFTKGNDTLSVSDGYGYVTYTSIKPKGWDINTGIAPGITYQLNKRWLIDATLQNIITVSFSHEQTQSLVSTPVGNSVGNSVDNSFNLSTFLSNANPSFSFGFRYLLNATPKKNDQ